MALSRDVHLQVEQAITGTVPRQQTQWPCRSLSDHRLDKESASNRRLINRMLSQNQSSIFLQAVTLAAALLILSVLPPPPHAYGLMLLPPEAPSSHGLGLESQAGPQPPCGTSPFPYYPDPDQSANVKSWSKADFGRDWKPPACTGWEDGGFTRLVTIAARFPYTSEADGLLRRMGAISALKGLRYWSTSHQQWRTLILDACALPGPDSDQCRRDFTPDEMREGKVLYFEEVDNISGKAIYRIRVLANSPNRLIFAVDNLSTIRYHLLPIFHAGELQSIYFLDRESDKVWRYYGMFRTGKRVNSLIAGNEASFVNRAVAFYRNLIGIPDTQEPPAAR
jgi:hypothetical protein